MRSNLLLSLLLLSITQAVLAGETDCSRRIYDFTPVSDSNPVVVKIGQSIEIPVSEYLAYQRAEHLNTTTNQLDRQQKKELLDGLIGEYLLVDEACRLGADEHPGFTSRMKYTRTIMLSDFLVEQEVHSKATNAEDYNRRLDDLQNRLFDAATIDVSIGDYDRLKAAARKINAVDTDSTLTNAVSYGNAASLAKIRDIMRSTPDSVLARYNGTPITVKQVLAVYAPLRPPRPPLETNDDLVNLLKPMIVPELMADEAARRGIENQPEFQNKLIENRNALLRIYMHGLIESESAAKLDVPDLEKQMKAWFLENTNRFAIPTPDGGKRIPTYEEVRKRVEGDYSIDVRDQLQAEKIAALRQSHEVKIDSAILDGI